MRIGELAKRAGCGADTVRYYEREGLLPPAERGNGNYRRYDADDVNRLVFIRNCRALEMSLAEIRALLAIKDGQAKDCAEVAAVLDAHIGHVTERMERLSRLLDELTALRAQCRGMEPVACCGILRGLAGEREQPQPETKKAGGSHLGGPHDPGSGGVTG